MDDEGRLIRYGLANESKKQNSTFKSSDLIGPLPVKITPEMLGKTVAIFTAIEVKPEGWKETGIAYTKAQRAYINHVKALGGIAGFAQSVQDYHDIVNRYFDR